MIPVTLCIGVGTGAVSAPAGGLEAVGAPRSVPGAREHSSEEMTGTPLKVWGRRSRGRGWGSGLRSPSESSPSVAGFGLWVNGHGMVVSIVGGSSAHRSMRSSQWRRVDGIGRAIFSVGVAGQVTVRSVFRGTLTFTVFLTRRMGRIKHVVLSVVEVDASLFIFRPSRAASRQARAGDVVKSVRVTKPPSPREIRSHDKGKSDRTCKSTCTTLLQL